MCSQSNPSGMSRKVKFRRREVTGATTSCGGPISICHVERGAQKRRGAGRRRRMPEGVEGILVSAAPRLCARHDLCRRRRYFFLALALVLLAVFGLAADFVALPDPHPQRLHAIVASFQKNIRISGTIYLYFIGDIAGGTLARPRRKSLQGLTAEDTRIVLRPRELPESRQVTRGNRCPAYRWSSALCLRFRMALSWRRASRSRGRFIASFVVIRASIVSTRSCVPSTSMG